MSKVTNIDYEKVKKINEAIKWIWNRIDQIDKLLHERTQLLIPDSENIKGLLEEREQLFETYQQDLKELQKCYE